MTDLQRLYKRLKSWQEYPATGRMASTRAKAIAEITRDIELIEGRGRVADRQSALPEKSDIQILIEAMEAGLPSPTNWRNFASVQIGDDDNSGPVLAHRAYHGSLDAAKALHEALLPGWEWGRTEGNIYVTDPRRGSMSTKWGGPNENPARSWLIAILRAVEAGR